MDFERNILKGMREIYSQGSCGRIEREKAEVTFPEWSDIDLRVARLHNGMLAAQVFKRKSRIGCSQMEEIMIIQ